MTRWISPDSNEADCEAALKAVSALVDMDPASGPPEGDTLEILAILVEKYEAEHFPMAAPNPIDATSGIRHIGTRSANAHAMADGKRFLN